MAVMHDRKLPLRFCMHAQDDCPTSHMRGRNAYAACSTTTGAELECAQRRLYDELRDHY